MSVKVAINGFGRIGRLAFRQMFGAEGYEVVAINDLTSAKMLAHLLKYDSTQGNYVAQGHTVDFHEGEGEDNYIVVDGKKIVIYKMPNAADLPWGKLGVDVVLECTGFYTSKAKAQAHIDAGARKVVISAPAGNDLPTIVYNVNHKTLTKDDKIISAASCTTNAITPIYPYIPIAIGMAKKYDKNFGMGSLISMMLPYSIAFLLVWVIQMIVWVLFNLPLGPGVSVFL